MEAGRSGYNAIMAASGDGSGSTKAGPPSRASSLLLGVGLGGFIDGIVLHQILQWHHMVSDVDAYPTSTLAGLEGNVVADGFFHVVTWILVLVGSVTALSDWQQGRWAPSLRFHFGLVLAGWGIFNLVEGVVDHQILGIHHVRDDLGGPLAWDLGFLVLGAILLAGGLLLYRTSPPPEGPPGRRPG